MKARRKDTGEIVEVFTKSFLSIDGKSLFLPEQLELLVEDRSKSLDQIRVDASIAAMQGILSNSTIVSSASFDDIAEAAVNMADALILKLEQNDKV